MGRFSARNIIKRIARLGPARTAVDPAATATILAAKFATPPRFAPVNVPALAAEVGGPPIDDATRGALAVILRATQEGKPIVFKGEVVRVGWDRISDPPTVCMEIVHDEGGTTRVVLEADEHAELLRDLEYAGDDAFTPRDPGPDDEDDDDLDEAMADAGVTGI